MEAVAGQLGGVTDDHVSGRSGVLERVAALALRMADADEASVFLNGRRRELSVVARSGIVVGGSLPVDQAVERGSSAETASAAAAPLMLDGEAIGALAVSRIAPCRRFSTTELTLLRDLAAVAASSLLQRARADAALRAGADVLARVVDMRDTYTGAHSVQVGVLACSVAQRIGMPEDEMAVLDCAARLHDVGKLAVPDAILRKPGPLDELEWAVMRQHPEWGARWWRECPVSNVSST